MISQAIIDARPPDHTQKVFDVCYSTYESNPYRHFTRDKMKIKDIQHYCKTYGINFKHFGNLKYYMNMQSKFLPTDAFVYKHPITVKLRCLISHINTYQTYQVNGSKWHNSKNMQPIKF